MSLYIWQNTGDRWTFTYFDIPRFIDPSLRHYRLSVSDEEKPIIDKKQGVQKNKKQPNKHDLRLTALAVHPKFNYIACGSNTGTVWMFDIYNKSIIQHASLSGFKIAEMSFSPSGEYLAVAYSTGLINLYQASTGFDFILQLEQPLKSIDVSKKSSKLYYIGVVLSFARKDEKFQSNMEENTHQMLQIEDSSFLPCVPITIPL